MTRPRIVPQRGFNLDYIMWLFTRISGLAIILLSLISIIAALAMGARTQMDLPTFLRWAFFPNPNHVVNSNIPDITVGWSNAIWQIYAFLMILLASVHGFNGVRMVIEDYLRSPLAVLILRWSLLVIWVGCLGVAVYVILAS